MALRFIRTATALAAAVCVAVGTSACSHDSSGTAAEGAVGADAPLKIPMNVYSRTLPYFQDMIRGVQDVAKQDGTPPSTSPTGRRIRNCSTTSWRMRSAPRPTA